MRIAGLVTAGVAGLLGLTFLGGSWYTVDQGYRAVLLRNGALIGTAEPGLGFKMPLIDSAIDISVQERIKVYGDENSGLQAYSFDQQTGVIRISVNYSIPAGKVSDVYVRFGGEEGLVARLLDPNVFKSTKDTFGQFTAARSIQERGKLQAMILSDLQAATEGEPLVVTSVQIENIDFSAEYEKSIEKRMQAEIEVQKVKQEAEREKITAQITVTKAQAEADSTLARAKADAQAVTLRGEAEANAIRAKGAALRDNPALVSLIQAERWDGKLPTTMVPNSTVPFMTMGDKNVP